MSSRAPGLDEVGKVVPIPQVPERLRRAVRVRRRGARLPGALGSALCLIVGLAATSAAEERLQPRGRRCRSRLGERSARACAIGCRAVLERRGVHGHV